MALSANYRWINTPSNCRTYGLASLLSPLNQSKVLANYFTIIARNFVILGENFTVIGENHPMTKPNLLLFCALLTVPGCAHGKAVPHQAAAEPKGVPERRVLVVVNDNSAASREIGAYYAKKRHIPAAYICHIRCAEQEEIEEDAFDLAILTPVADSLARAPVSNTVDYIVLTKGVPLRIHSTAPSLSPTFSPNGDSVDGRLVTQDMAGMGSPSANPFFKSEVRFSHKKFSLYLTTRLDGYNVAEAEGLVDRALLAKPAPGLFLLDACPSRSGGQDPTHLNDDCVPATAILKERHLSVMLDQSETFVGRIPNLMGYWSWGSNDPHYDAALYKGNTFRPGAIAETVVSTSAHTMLRQNWWQSLIADLVEDKVTGVKGYVDEPYTLAMAHPDVLFDRYTRGWNLAESFYAASQVTHWKDVVLGDPLCAPYAKH